MTLGVLGGKDRLVKSGVVPVANNPNQFWTDGGKASNLSAGMGVVIGLGEFKTVSKKTTDGACFLNLILFTVAA